MPDLKASEQRKKDKDNSTPLYKINKDQLTKQKIVEFLLAFWSIFCNRN